MTPRTFSEQLFEEFCATNALQCARVPEGADPTPDYQVMFGDVVVACEVKQVDPNAEDLEELRTIGSGAATGRFVPNRFSGLLKTISRQLKRSAFSGVPTLVVIYDNTPFKAYTMHADVVQAMFGNNSVRVSFTKRTGETQVSEPFFGGNRRMTPTTNTSISAVGILGGGPVARPLSLRIYHNRFARVRLEPRLFDRLPITQPVLPDATTVSMR